MMRFKHYLLLLVTSLPFMPCAQQEAYSFKEVDEFPEIEGYACDSSTVDPKSCFEEKLAAFYDNTFEYSYDQYEDNEDLIAYTQFVITRKGKIKQVKVRSQNEDFKIVTTNVLNRIPISSPATKGGEPVDMIFTMPFYYKFENRIKTYSYEFSKDLDTIPVFPGCEGKNDAENRECFKEKLQNHIRKHFYYPKEAQRKKIQGTVIVTIRIGTTGSVTNYETAGPDPVLSHETLSIIKKLPTFKPAIKNGKAVETSISFPVTYRLTTY
ncbi:energy transducer TonB [Flagellimonas allohymeniacidonis]|uniref:TonB family protein n=1 Tax=Flagellimonas allohymeniacidonis TaxID=2517819 RepID=A0A4Q8Q9J4_9FLAO|nr:energy transducer TonB [Allomuricauda hymeniacidonis]TAI46945.1 TonB family protein [Allomuricauda hymeniacidonis]